MAATKSQLEGSHKIYAGMRGSKEMSFLFKHDFEQQQQLQLKTQDFDSVGQLVKCEAKQTISKYKSHQKDRKTPISYCNSYKLIKQQD